MRVAAAGIVRQAGLAQQVRDRIGAVRRSTDPERFHALEQDVRHAHPWIERAERVLKDHLGLAAQCAQRRLSLLDTLSAQANGASGRFDELQNGLADGGLSAAGLAHEGQGTACFDVERDRIHRAQEADGMLNQTAADREVHIEVAHLQQRRTPRNANRCRCRGTNGLRRQFPESMATHALAAEHAPVRRNLAAKCDRMRTAGSEAATGQAAIQARHLARDRGQPPGITGARQGLEQHAAVRMLRTGEEGVARSLLDQFAGVHDPDAIRILRDHAEIMSDQQHPHALIGAQSPQQLQHLRLDGHIQRRRRLVGDQQLRPSGESHRDHRALPQAAGEFERIGIQPTFRIGHADRFEQRARGLRRGTAGDALVQLQRLADLGTDFQNRVECEHRLLEDHRHAPATDSAHVALRQRQNLLALKPHAARSDAAAVG